VFAFFSSYLRVFLAFCCPLPLLRHSLRRLPPPLPGCLLRPPFPPYLHRALCVRLTA
jgi:hypothetical protein